MEKIVLGVIFLVFGFGLIVSIFPQLKGYIISCQKCGVWGKLRHVGRDGYGDNIFRCQKCKSEASIGAGG